VDSSLERKLKRLMLLRVVLITTLLLIAVYVETVSETLVSVNPLYFLIAATYGLTLLHVVLLRLIPSFQTRVYLQVIGDLAVITGLVYLTGGTGLRGGFLLLYPISVLSGSVLLSWRRGLGLAAVAALLYGSMLWSVRSGVVPPWGLLEVLYLSPRQLAYSVFLTAVGCSTVAMIGGFLSESLRSADERLQEAVEQVADLRELNDAIVNSIQSGLLTADVGARVRYVNAFGAAVLAKPVNEVLGRTLLEVFGSWLLDGAALEARMTKPELRRLELPYERPDRTVIELGISLAPLESAQPTLRGYLVVFKDVTDIKRLEQEVRTKEKLAAVGEMAAYLAHEIRNPLGSISGSAQVLVGETGPASEHGRLLRIITRESKRLSDTLNQFLSDARVDLRPTTPIDLGPLLDEAVTLLRNGSEVLPDHVVEFQRDNGPHLCLADRDRIAQVFWNLARNGLEAMPGGGVLRISLRRQAREIVLSVRDQGRGLAGDEPHRIFEPFRSERPRGTGLGLAVVYRILREHRGDIAVRSVPGEGTEVEIRLPLVAVTVPA
jgi:two-component system sensor histidine kinase PilS (NtrC family)